MEDLHRTYKDRVNFLYMYVNEAHPDPRTAPCGSTPELGWTHATENTTTTAQRAQRTRWLKNDFDLTFPYIIDSIDNTIKSDYLPPGFYAGDGSPLGTLTPRLPSFGYTQINKVLAEIDLTDARDVRAEVGVLTEGGRVLAYASTVDILTGDPIFQTAWARD